MEPMSVHPAAGAYPPLPHAGTSLTRRKTILLYRTGLLPSTQTFVIAQADAVRSFAVRYAGIVPVDGGLSATRSPILLCEPGARTGRFREIVYKVLGFAPRFYDRIGKTSPCLIHAHFLMDGIHALPLKKHFNVPLIVTLHGHLTTGGGRVLTARDLDGQLYKRRLKTLWQEAARFICVSEFVKQKVMALGFPKEKLLVHYIGIDLKTFRLHSETRDPNMVVFVGRLVERKGCSYLLDAMRLVQRKRPESHLVIIGKGPRQAELEEKAAAYGLRCSFLGNQSHTAVRQAMRRARVFCAPSVTGQDGDTEALGMVFAESQALGTPVVSFDHGGIPEVVQHEVTGLLAREGDAEQLADHILRYLEDNFYWKACSVAGNAAMAARFDIEQQTRELENIYESCLLEHPRGDKR